MFDHYIETAKSLMMKGNWKGAMFVLGKAEMYAGAKETSAYPLEDKLEIIDDLVQRCYTETKPA